MQKRGQVTIFIILGIIIVVAIVFSIVLSKSIGKEASETEVRKASSFAEEVSFVQEHVEDCVEKGLKESIPYFGTVDFNNYEEYYDSVGNFVNDRLDDCLDFSSFTGLKIMKDEEKSIDVFMDEKRTLISAIAKFKVNINKGSQSETLSEFHVDVALKEEVYIGEQVVI